jgi:hypothetical protein
MRAHWKNDNLTNYERLFPMAALIRQKAQAAVDKFAGPEGEPDR